MKRYWLFGGLEYYPSGGMSDFVSDHETIKAAVEAGDALLREHEPYAWAHIFDQLIGKVLIEKCVRYSPDWRTTDKDSDFQERLKVLQ